jgi:hypothetical protein
MPAANDLLDRDLAIFQDRVRGLNKLQLADKYGLNRHTITEALDRARAAMPERDRAEIFDQSMEIIDTMLATFIPPALALDKGAARIVDRYLGRRNEMLGLDSPAKLELSQAQGQVQHERVDVRQELAALVARIRGGA